MAGAALHASMAMPMIKCSNCGSDVDLSMMGDHKCLTESRDTATSTTTRTDQNRAPLIPSPLSHQPLTPDSDYGFPSTSPKEPSERSFAESNLDDIPEDRSSEEQETEPSSVPVIGEPSNPKIEVHDEDKQETRRSRPKPPPIDMAAANAMRRPSSPSTPSSSARQTHSQSPDSSHGSLRSPAGAPRSATSSMRPPTPPSPDLPIAQDCAFPPFPVKSRPQSPVTRPRAVSKPSQNSVTGITQSPLARNAPMYPPSVPKTSLPIKQSSGSRLLRRMNSIASISSTDEKKKTEDVPALPEKSPGLGIFRRKSSKKISKRDISHLNHMGDGSVDGDVPAVPMLPSPALLPQTVFEKRLPSGPAPPRPPRPDAVDEVIERLNKDGMATAQISSGTNSPAVTPALATPEIRTSPVFAEDERGRSEKRISDASVYSTLATSPERIRSSSARGLPKINEHEDYSHDPSVDTVPPLPNLSTENVRRLPFHTPTESTSSNGSKSTPDDRSFSLRSSPPTSHGSSFSSETADLMLKPANFSRPRPPEPLVPPAANSQASASPIESPVDPFVHTKPGSLVATLKGSADKPEPESKVEQQPSDKKPEVDVSKISVPPIPAEEAERRPGLGRRRTTGSKGSCRGCGQQIQGKSVKAADGRISGRFHRECFTCRTCRSPFPTLDFYVLDDQPYCAYHYHVQNQSLCQTCNKGIEGQFLETHSRKKYHLYCFTCHECHKPLSRDYFEINNTFYCELHVKHAHQKSSPLGPGRKFPERRTTRLMMM